MFQKGQRILGVAQMKLPDGAYAVRVLNSGATSGGDSDDGSEVNGNGSVVVPPLATLSEQEIADFDCEQVDYEIAMLEESMKVISPNMTAIRDYQAKEREYADRVKAIGKGGSALAQLQREIEQELDLQVRGTSVVATVRCRTLTLKLQPTHFRVSLRGSTCMVGRSDP